MTFPVLASSSQSSSGEVTSHSITIPACAIGDLIVVTAAVDNRNSGGNTNITAFARLAQQSEGGGVHYGSVFTRLVDGSESWYNAGAGGSATMDHAADALCVYVILRITGASGNVELSGAGGNGGSADPPSLTTSWGTKDVKWIATEHAQGVPVYVASPSGYTHIAHGLEGTSFIGASLGVAHKDATASTENPGAWDYGSASSWVGYTIAVEPAGAVVVPPGEDAPPYEPPTPGGAILEIYTSEPGSARWDSALWGVDHWAVAGWQDVTPEGVNVEILWGSSRPELGILSKPDPASWAIDFYDRERTLDPANDESPYFGDLLPGLPVRLSHNGIVVKQGVMESLGFEHSREFGTQYTSYMRVTDILSVLGNAQVPSDSTLSDTLYARARDAISAAGVTVTVLPDPPGGDPALAAWVTGQDYSALDWILDAAESVLHVPYVTNLGYLGFRPYATPLDRSRVLASPNLIGLQTIVQHNGVFSVASALNDPDTGVYTTREVTPKPRYGVREYRRDRVTPDPGDWALAVLRDRAVPGLRYVPGEVYPLTAADVTTYATIEAVERVGIVYLEASPALIEDVIVVGGRIAVTGKKDSEAIWSFTFEAAQTAPSPLVTEDTLDLLIRDDDPTEFLYPDG